MEFKRGDKILLIGDSITDCGRREEKDKLGYGYVRHIHDYYNAVKPELELEFVNTGIGGDRVVELEQRWREDVLEYKPNWVSVSIGINDVWRKLNPDSVSQHIPVERYEKVLRGLLRQVKEELGAGLILMEPTIIDENAESPGNRMLAAYVEAVHRLAGELGAVIVPTHRAFLRHLAARNRQPLTFDGVHMTPVGNMLMAHTWIQAFAEHA